jgi:hypothetical protein
MASPNCAAARWPNEPVRLSQSLERGQPYRRAKDFSAPDRRATHGRRIPSLVGVVVLVLRPFIAAIAGFPKDARAGPVTLIAIGCFVIGALGIAAWTVGNRAAGPRVSTQGTQSPGIVSGGNATVTYGASPMAIESAKLG